MRAFSDSLFGNCICLAHGGWGCLHFIGQIGIACRPDNFILCSRDRRQNVAYHLGRIVQIDVALERKLREFGLSSSTASTRSIILGLSESPNSILNRRIRSSPKA